MFKIKRVYEAPDPGDGVRILVDRLWPRGLSKDKAKVDLWLRDVAPSDAARKRFGHEPKTWPAFRRTYQAELRRHAALLRTLRRVERDRGTVTLLYAASDTARNNAVVLAAVLAR